MNKRKKKITIIAIVFILALVILAGSFFVLEKRKENKQEEAAEQEKMRELEKNKNENPVEAIKDLIDGEYEFQKVDTSDWKVYRNEEVGFEVRIPRDWFCGGIAMDQDSKENIVCMLEDEKKGYYAGKGASCEGLESCDVNKDLGNFVMISNINCEKNRCDLNDFRENVENGKKNGEKIYTLEISGKKSVKIDGRYYKTVNIFMNNRKWQITDFPTRKKDTKYDFDSFLYFFKFI